MSEMSKEKKRMELQNPRPVVPEKDLESVAAKIQPLPHNVVPSERFLEQMRRRLLQLDAATANSKRAA
jgi:hypothetical protein